MPSMTREAVKLSLATTALIAMMIKPFNQQTFLVGQTFLVRQLFFVLSLLAKIRSLLS
jgi:hypothetical protein